MVQLRSFPGKNTHLFSLTDKELLLNLIFVSNGIWKTLLQKRHIKYQVWKALLKYCLTVSTNHTSKKKQQKQTKTNKKRANCHLFISHMCTIISHT
jgi:hypothetical protein